MSGDDLSGLTGQTGGDYWPGTPQGGESPAPTGPSLRAGQRTEPFPLSAVFTLCRATTAV